jgi:RNA-directed DNA polymerase
MENRKERQPRATRLNACSATVAAKCPAGHSAVEAKTSAGHRDGFFASRRTAESQRLSHGDEGRPTPSNAPSGNARAASPRRSKRKAHSLIDKVYRWENLYQAWRRVRRNKGVHGLDRVTIRMFEADVEKHLREIQRKLKEQRYTPSPVRRVYIPKPSQPRKRRPLGIPIVADRIVQQAIFQVVDPLFDHSMSDRSFGFRKGRKAHHAVATLIEDAREGFRYVVDADIASFFDEIDHNVVMSCVRARIADGRVLDLFEAFLKAGVSEAGVISVPARGVPQGGVISPWLSNLVLDHLDQAIEAQGWRHVRYADDFVVLCPSPKEAQRALEAVKEVLGTLKLSLHETKTRLTDFEQGFEFLGFAFRHLRIGIREASIERLKERVRSLTRRQQGRNVDAVLADLNPVLRGWAGYFGVAQVSLIFRLLDSWIRMRMRSFKYKRRCYHDNWRLPTRRLQRWGLLSLQECRPRLRLAYVRARGSGERPHAPCDEGPTRGRPVL